MMLQGLAWHWEAFGNGNTRRPEPRFRSSPRVAEDGIKITTPTLVCCFQDRTERLEGRSSQGLGGDNQIVLLINMTFPTVSAVN
jgi:hypothetical protein